MADSRKTPRPVAVALADERDSDTTMIRASGTGKRAEHILDVAFANGVPVRQDESLANILGQFDELSPIPVAALEAVAEVMSHVYTESRRAKDKS